MNTSLSAVSTSLPLCPPPHPPGVPAVQIGLPGPLEGRKELLEPLRAQAGERLERAGVARSSATYSYCIRYRTSSRMGNTPESTSSNMGFRVVR